MCDAHFAYEQVIKKSRVISIFVHLNTGLQQQGIFRVPGSQVEVNDIKNAFERGQCLAAFFWLILNSICPLRVTRPATSINMPHVNGRASICRCINASDHELCHWAECATCAQVRTPWWMIRVITTSTLWLASWSCILEGWKTRCSPKNVFLISYPQPVSHNPSDWPSLSRNAFAQFFPSSELDSGVERAHQLHQIIVTLQRPVMVVMRYLFAFLNQ